MTTTIKQHIPIFVSSTFTDLEPYRKAVFSTLDKLKLGVSGMEIFGARSAEPLQTCVDEVMKCKVFIGIIGMRYGSIDEKTGKSFVHIEYETALEKKIDILIYLIDEDKAQIPPKFFDTKSALKLEDFKELLRKKHTIETFLSPEDLGNKVGRDLIRLFTDEGLVVKDEEIQPSSQSEKINQLLNKFDLMPDRFQGSEVELIIKFSGKPRAVSESLCKAIDLRFGSSLSRSITIVNLSLNNFVFLNELYAENDGCDLLFNAPDNKEYKIIAKLAFGQEKRLVIQSDLLLSPALSFFGNNTIKNLDTGEVFKNYITQNYVKVVIFVKKLDGI